MTIVLFRREAAVTQHMTERLTIKRLGPIDELSIEPRPLTILVGKQASGKSLIAQCLYFFRGFNAHLARNYSSGMRISNEWENDVLRKMLNELRGVEFGYFANGTARISYEEHSTNSPWTIAVYGNNRRVRANSNLRSHMQQLAKQWEEDKQALGTAANYLRQVFIPTERSLFTRLIHNQASTLYASFQPQPFRQFADILQKAYMLYKDIFYPHRKTPNPSPVIKISQRILDYQRKALAGEAYVPKHGSQTWKWRALSGGRPPKVIPVEATASGQAEAWPFFVIASTIGAFFKETDFYFEEPETHLHPAAQVQIMRAIACLVEEGRRFVLTTHSPYILYIINNMIQRHLTGPNHKGSAPTSEPTLDPDLVAAYRVGRTVSDIMDRSDTQLIDAEELESVASELAAEFDDLLEKVEPENGTTETTDAD